MFNPKTSSEYHWVRVPTKVDRPLARRRGITAQLMDMLRISPERAVESSSRSSFARALADVGVPATNKSPEDELIQLLQEAAEIEHGLMLQYLYATYSLKVLLISGIVRLIAIEEMGHFITVQNLLVACGADPHFGRDDWGKKTCFQPFPFRLEPASVGSLAKYAVAEMPDTSLVPAGIQGDLASLIAEGDAAAGTTVEARRVGLLYAKIYWLLRKDDAPLLDPTMEPWPGFPVAEMAGNPELAGRHVRDGFVGDAHAINALPQQWRGNYTSVIVEPISGRDAALSAIAEIAAQGEGFANTPQGHFERFVDAWRFAKSAVDLAVPAAIDPFYPTGGPRTGPGNEITSAAGRQFAQIGDKLYELILLCTAAHLLLPSGTTTDVRAKPAKAAIAAMRDCLSVLAGSLKSVPLSDQNQDLVCGPPFIVPTTQIAPDLKSVLDRARAVLVELHKMITDFDRGNAPQILKVIADGIGETLDDPIATLLDALPA